MSSQRHYSPADRLLMQADAALRDQALRRGVVRVAPALPGLSQSLLNLHGWKLQAEHAAFACERSCF